MLNHQNDTIMKKIMITLTMMLLNAATGKAMSYEQARNEALFLTDKMAYELNLTDEQYEAAYEINLDYLMGVTSYDDVYSTYWERRNLDLSYILLDWQWQAFINATYFYRPLYWRNGYWHFAVYLRYPHRDYFYFGRPVFYASYRGGHAWHHVGGRGYYYGRRDHFRPATGRTHFGMLDRWNRGDFRHNPSHRPNGRTHFEGGNRNSSTRTTVNFHDNHHSQGTLNHHHDQGTSNHHHDTDRGQQQKPNTNHNQGNISHHNDNRPEGGSHSSGTFSRSHSGNSNSGSHSSGTFSRSHNGSSVSSGSHSSGSFSRSHSGSSVSSGSHRGGGSGHFGRGR